ncbi:MAG: FecR domain-containing protein [Bacteroidales bacterium]|nr:FecR domain-containing protein [Bacteroidales bacterium]
MDTYTLLKYLRCEASSREEAAVQKWLASDTDGSHADKYRNVRIVFEGVTIHDNGSVSQQVSRPRWHRKASFALRLVSVAAVLMVAFMLGGRHVMSSLSSEMEAFSVPCGKNVQLILTDGTRLWINGGTEVEIPVVFARNHRTVRLHSGEILLDVAKDEERPFIVDTYAGKVTVLGTRFDIMADEIRNVFSTSLLEGSVTVMPKGEPETEYVLKPNEVLRMEDGEWSISRLKDPKAVSCWTDGIIDIADIPFDELMYRFELAFDVDIVIECENLPQLSYNRGKVRVSDGVMHALDVLSKASDFTYERDYITNTIYIK